MADKHPYVQSLSAIVQVIEQLRKSFPNTLNAEVLKRLSLAPNTENRVIDLMRFLGFLDDQNTRTALASKVFTLHDQQEFQAEFANVLRNAYAALFDLYKEDAWNTESSKLITFFRRTDQSTERVGSEQAKTFRTLAAYAGYGELPALSSRAKPDKTDKPKPPSKPKTKENPTQPPVINQGSATPIVSSVAPAVTGGMALTVRIEINLPVAPDQETYDRIFKSIRENLLNG